MKLSTPHFVVIFFFGLIAFGRTQSNEDSFSSMLGRAWETGNKIAVLKIAEGRLQQSPEDLASQLVLLEYAAGFLDVDTLRKLVPIMHRSSSKVKTDNFTKKKDLLDNTLKVIESMLPMITPEMREAEAYKGSIKGKRLSMQPLIEALEMDGLVTPLTVSERNQLFSLSKQEPKVGNRQHTDSDHSEKLSLSEIKKSFPSPALPDRNNATREKKQGEASWRSWLVVAVLIVAAIGLLWLVLKRRS